MKNSEEPVFPSVKHDFSGLTKREYMVSQILAGWNLSQSAISPEHFALGAIYLADEVLKQLELTDSKE